MESPAHDLLTPPVRRRSPRAAIVLLPLTFSLMLLGWGVGYLVVSLATAVGATLRALFGRWRVWLVLNAVWAADWLASERLPYNTLIFRLLTYYPYWLGDRALRHFPVDRLRWWWGDTLGVAQQTWKRDGLHWSVFLVPCTVIVLLLLAYFLLTFLRTLKRQLTSGGPPTWHRTAPRWGKESRR